VQEVFSLNGWRDPVSSENIFSALAKYNSAIDENYLTESFVFIINTLLDTGRPMAIDILNRLCVNDKEFSFSLDENSFISARRGQRCHLVQLRSRKDTFLFSN
jgi:hypothetical protein